MANSPSDDLLVKTLRLIRLYGFSILLTLGLIALVYFATLIVSDAVFPEPLSQSSKIMLLTIAAVGASFADVHGAVRGEAGWQGALLRSLVATAITFLLILPFL